MECLLSGNQIKCFHRAFVCLSRIGHELVLEALPGQLRFRTINTAKSASLVTSFKAQFFDAYQVLPPVARCRVLLKSVCSVFRTPTGSMGRLSMSLPSRDATKLQWTVECYNGLSKTYWISCQEDVDNYHVAVDRNLLRSFFVVKPRDLNRLLANFQSSLQELTLIATEPSSSPSDSEGGTECKAIELRSYIDVAKETTDGGALHTQLWIDPAEELQAYSHTGAAVDVTFSLKELKAFLTLCEGSEADMQFNFEKAGKPIILSPRLGLDNAQSDFDATLVLATMLLSQLHTEDGANPVANASAGSTRASQGNGQMNATPTTSIERRDAGVAPGSAQRSDHTAVWSELSGSAARTGATSAPAQRQEVRIAEETGPASEEMDIGVQRLFHPQLPSGRTCDLHQSSPARDVDVPPDVERGGRWCGRPTLERHSAVQEIAQNTSVTASAWEDRQIGSEQAAASKSQMGNGSGFQNAGDDDDFCIQSTPPDTRNGYG